MRVNGMSLDMKARTSEHESTRFVVVVHDTCVVKSLGRQSHQRSKEHDCSDLDNLTYSLIDLLFGRFKRFWQNDGWRRS